MARTVRWDGELPAGGLPLAKVSARHCTPVPAPLSTPPAAPSPRIARARVKPAVPRVVATSQASGSPRPAPRDYVTANAVGAITASLRAAPPPAEPKWLARPGYGAAPAYLARNVQLVGARRAEARASCDAAAAAEAARSGRRELSPEERGELLAALKARWEAVSRRYQGITHKRISSSTSTVSEIRAKETAEGELRALEADVARLSVNAPVYLLTA